MTAQGDLIRLQQAVRESRNDLSREYSGLIHELDFRRRLTESVKRHPLGWLGGAVSAGFLAILAGTGRGKRSHPGSALPASSPTTPAPVRAGWVIGALEIGKILYPVLRPALTELLGNLARSGFARRGRHG